ncbi:digestive cysteine proteinase 1 [Patella vulgata]|uniref:digestive cysteine proteinase 1 n=1 Tax=Patella vulgata TaxID=6465 RepID=UPI00217FE7B7|nr:digestive cysteine proteinase 1 [Patella vulgata]
MAKMVVAKICGVLFLAALCSSAKLNANTPTFATSYVVSGVLQLPYAEIKEPFTAMFDGPNKRSRVDYYNGMVVNLLRGDMGQYGMTLELAPMTNYQVRNQRMCFQTNGTVNATVMPQSVLPDLTGFQKMSQELMNGKMCDLWQMKQSIGNKSNTYSMWLDSSNQDPVRYEMYGYDSLLGSHFDRYYLDYMKYTAGGSIPASAFDPPANLTCGGFPGPGAEKKVRMNPMSEYVNHFDQHVDEMFESYKKTHDKKYKDIKEHEERKHVFRQNVRYIHSKNRAGLTFKVAVNHLADRSAKELQMMNGYRYSKGPHGGQYFDTSKYNVQDLPDQLDWRIMGVVSPVKDQGVCGSCWSFGTTGTIEGALAIMSGKVTRLSQQQLVDCSWGEGNNGCDGGEDFRSYDYIMKKGGLSSDEQYGQYLAADGYCHDDKVTPVVKVTGYVNVTTWNATAMKLALFNHGPISIAIDASHKSLSFYSSGIYSDPQCGNKPDDLDHAVLAVGYGVYMNEPYWLVKNSWSTYWGNDGYVLFSQKDNMCGVLSAPTYATVTMP